MFVGLVMHAASSPFKSTVPPTTRWGTALSSGVHRPRTCDVGQDDATSAGLLCGPEFSVAEGNHTGARQQGRWRGGLRKCNKKPGGQESYQVYAENVARRKDAHKTTSSSMIVGGDFNSSLILGTWTGAARRPTYHDPSTFHSHPDHISPLLS
jgi:hypothetical protein